MNELELVNYFGVGDAEEVIVEFVHHHQQVLLATVSPLVRMVLTFDPRHNKVNVTSLDGQLSGHTSEDLDANIPVPVLIMECLLDDRFHHVDESFSLLSNGVLQLVNLFNLAFHFVLQIVKEIVVSVLVGLDTRHAVF